MDTKSLKNNLPLPLLTALLGGVIALAGSSLLTSNGPTIDPPQAATGPPAAEHRAPVEPRRPQVTVPAGTPVEVRLAETLSTQSTVAGEHFTARVVDPVLASGVTVIPAGAVVSGVVTESARSKRIGGRARLSLALTSFSVNGRQRSLSGEYTALGKKQTARDAATIGGATAGGALLGRIVGHQRGEDARGTLAGAVVGGAVGTGVALSNRAPHVILPAGSTITVRLASSV